MTEVPVIKETSHQPGPTSVDYPKWTILIYQAGDNNLSEECVYALKEMKKVGTQDAGLRSEERPKLNVIVQFDPLGRGNPTRRFKIGPAGDDGTLECDEIRPRRKRETDTGDPKTLLDFLCESIDQYPTDYYMVVLAGHGAGIAEGFFLQDDERPLSSIPSSFPIPLLKSVFRSPRLKAALGNKKINILGFDACMMSMIEICYQLRRTGILDLVIASEGFTLNSGWPFDRVLAHLKHYPDTSPPLLADFIATEYVRFYHDYYLGGLSVDQSIINLNRIDELKAEVDELAEAMIREFELEHPGLQKHYRESDSPFQDAMLLAHWAAQSYNGEQCVDLYDFCDQLQKRWPNRRETEEISVWEACERVKRVIQENERGMIRKSCYSGSAFQHSHGVSIYFPWAQYDFAPSYRKMDFARRSIWTKFLRIYLRATKRLPRQPVRFRSTPPTSRGPEGRIHSMRNPPTRFPVSDCILKIDASFVENETCYEKRN